jgi:multidrug efflux pump
MSKYAEADRGIYSQTKDVERYFVVAGNPTVSQGISFVGLTDWKTATRRIRPRSPRSCSAQICAGIPGVNGLPGHAAVARPEPARARR